MRRCRTTALSALVALTLPLAGASAAHANAFDSIFHDYQKTGKIDPCKYTRGQLQQANGQVPNDIEAYAPDFPNALQAALEARAGGACAKQPAAAGAPGGAGTTTPGAATAAGTPTTPAPPAPAGATVTPAPTPDPTAAAAAGDHAIARAADRVRDSDAGTPAPFVALAVLGGLLALGGLVYGLARWLAFDPRWLRHSRHAIAEAGFRVSNTWSEFTDWVRLGH